jgi:hypothetical protein
MIFGVQGMRSLFRAAARSFFRIWPEMAIGALFWHFLAGSRTIRMLWSDIQIESSRSENDSEAVKRD